MLHYRLQGPVYHPKARQNAWDIFENPGEPVTLSGLPGTNVAILNRRSEEDIIHEIKR